MIKAKAANKDYVSVLYSIVLTIQKPYLTTSHENLFLNAGMKVLILLRIKDATITPVSQ